MEQTGKNESAPIIIAISLLAISVLVVWLLLSIKYLDSDSQLVYKALRMDVVSFLAIPFFVLEVGSMVYLGFVLTYLQVLKTSLLTVLLNYLFLLLEAFSLMFAMFAVNVSFGSQIDTTLGWLFQSFPVLIFLILGFHILSYPRSLSGALGLFIAPAVYFGLQLRQGGWKLTGVILSAENSLFMMGYALLAAITLGFFVVLVKYYFKFARTGAIKLPFLIIILLYCFFVLLPSGAFLTGGFGEVVPRREWLTYSVGMGAFIFVMLQQIWQFSNLIQLGE